MATINYTYGFLPVGSGLDITAISGSQYTNFEGTVYSGDPADISANLLADPVTLGAYKWLGNAGNTGGSVDWYNNTASTTYAKVYLSVYTIGSGTVLHNCALSPLPPYSSEKFTTGTVTNESGFTPTGWSITTTSTPIQSLMTIGLASGFSTGYVMYVGMEAVGNTIQEMYVDSDPTGTDVSGVEAQAVVFANVQPGNCLGGETLIRTPTGAKALQDLKSGDSVFGLDKDGVQSEVAVQVLKFAKALVLKGKQVGDLFISKDDLLFFREPQNATPCACGSSCDRCAPFTVKGYHQYVVTDLLDAKDAKRNEASWYHLVPISDADYTKAMCLESGLLSEFNRTSVTDMRAQGHVFELL